MTFAAKSITIAMKNVIDRVRTVRQVPADGMLPSDEKPWRLALLLLRPLPPKEKTNSFCGNLP